MDGQELWHAAFLDASYIDMAEREFRAIVQAPPLLLLSPRAVWSPARLRVPAQLMGPPHLGAL